MVDPYRTDDVGEIRRLLRGALDTLMTRVHALPPSELERLAAALGRFQDEQAHAPIGLLAALEKLAPEVPTALGICASPMVTLEPGPDGAEHMGQAVHRLGAEMAPGSYLLAKGLRIETDNARPTDIEFWVKGGNADMIERCPITEFARMTSFEGCVFSAQCPLTVGLEGPAGARVRIIVRGDRVPMMPFYSGLPASTFPWESQYCQRCGKPKGAAIDGCTCSTAGGGTFRG